MFCSYNNKIVNTDIIACVTCDDFVEYGTVHVHYHDNTSECVKGGQAINLVMLLCPSVLEGTKAKYKRHAWSVHNLIGHPLMQVLAWLGFTRFGLWVHDATVPKPLETK